MVAHARALWGGWWWLPALPWIGYAAGVALVGQLRWDHVAIALLAAACVYTNARTRRFFLAGLPFFAMFLIYDSMRYWREVGVTAERVLSCDLRSAELALFGVPVGGVRITPNDVFQRWHHPVVDLLCAIPYGSYVPIMVGTFSWFYLRGDDLTARRFAYICLIAHLFGFATYHLVPAAPPWYVRAHGCAIDLATGPNPAALARVDAMLGTEYFHRLYSRGSAVFGALPSLHVAYPLFGILATWRCVGRLSLALQFAYAAVMAFAAIYLDHHYVLDVLLGMTYAFIAYAIVQRVMPLPRPALAVVAPKEGSAPVSSTLRSREERVTG